MINLKEFNVHSFILYDLKGNVSTGGKEICDTRLLILPRDIFPFPLLPKPMTNSFKYLSCHYSRV